MHRKAVQSLLDVCDYSDEITTVMEDVSYERYMADRMLRLAVERLFEILGEALSRAVRFAPDITTIVPEIPQVIGMRNHISHGYDKIEDEIVWRAAKQHVPALRQQIESLLRAEGRWPE